MTVRTQPIDRDTGKLDEACLLTYYGRTPSDWEEASNEKQFVEFIDGRLIVHSPAGLSHQRLFGFVHHLMASFVEERHVGEILTGPFTMELAHERKFEPDLIFLTPRTRANLAPDRLVGPADLAIEIASPSTRAYDAGEKRECYRVGGVREYWMIDGIARVVTVDRPAGNQVLRAGSGVVASETCPGFWLRAEWLWEQPPPAVGTCLSEVLAGGG